MTSFFHRHRALVGLVLVALLLRLTFVLIIDAAPDFDGGDATWYMRNGYDLVATGETAGPVQSAPLYLVFVGSVQRVFPATPDAGATFADGDAQAIRIIQAVLGALLVVCAFVIGSQWLSPRAGWIAAIIFTITPTLIMETGHITSEGLFLACMLGALALYAARSATLTPRTIALVGLLLGLATLTRGVFLLFPLVIVAHLGVMRRTRWGRLAAVLLVVYGVTIATWTAYNLVVWDRLVIGSDGLLSFIHQGAEGKASPEEYDASIGVTADDTQAEREDKLRSEIQDSIFSAPLSWASHRVTELTKAYLQPHNTTYFAGESIREAAQDWLQNDRSPGGLRTLTTIDAFWAKLLLYVFHFSSLVLGAWSMIRLRRQWRTLLPLYGVIIYFTGIHVVLLALPRYLFPTYPAFTLFAAGLLAQWRLHANQPQVPASARSTQS